jgi:hypothetical protein
MKFVTQTFLIHYLFLVHIERLRPMNLQKKMRIFVNKPISKYELCANEQRYC